MLPALPVVSCVKQHMPFGLGDGVGVGSGVFAVGFHVFKITSVSLE